MSNGRPYRSSLFAGLLLILLGVIFFLDRIHPGFEIGRLIRLYWPLLLILWGVAKLLDRFPRVAPDNRARASFREAKQPCSCCWRLC